MKFKLLCIGAALSFLYMFSAETKENYSGLSATVPNANSSDSDNQKLQPMHFVFSRTENRQLTMKLSERQTMD